MKRLFKKNQIIITALAIMIVIAGYLNFTAEKTVPVNKSAEDNIYGDISEENLQSEQMGDIDSFPDEDMAFVSAQAESMDGAELPDAEKIGEAVLTSTNSASAFSASAKLNREQVRSRNEASLLEVINNTEIGDDMKEDAIASMNRMIDRAEKELAAETMLEAKGFPDSVVSMNDDTVDVIVGAAEITEAEKAQIEDIVVRKTECDISQVVITMLDE